MKLWTINTHSLLETDYEQKLTDFVDAVIQEKPDIIAMQEVNQLHTSDNVTISEDNHVYRAVKLLEERGIQYYWKWLPVKIGYGKYDEGLAIMSLSPITDTDDFLISNSEDYSNWKTRKILGIKTSNNDDWFYTVHMGWWNDRGEPFERHWRRLCAHIEDKEIVWLLGDFNSRADIRYEGYDLVRESKFEDTYMIAEKKDEGFTVEKAIDGWKESANEKIRLDYIFCNKKCRVKSSAVIFNDENYPIISDHYGVSIII